LFTWAATGGIKSKGLDYTYFTFIPSTLIAAWKGFESATVVILLINFLAVFLVGKQANSDNSLALQFGLMTVTFICFLLSAYISELVKETNTRRGLEKQLRYDATHDSLTGLYNRAWFIDRLQQINQTDENSNRLFALLFLDLDRFKVVNDTLGHIIGDKLLVEISQQLQQCLPEVTSVARLGGDEFTIILEQITNISQVNQIVENICQSLEKTYKVNGYEVYTTVSVGVALNSKDRYSSALDWLRDADIALSEAKAKGKSRYNIFDETMYQRVRNQAQLEQDLRKAIDELND
jgi:diguanylate cyclase (GGDEF)-like protein